MGKPQHAKVKVKRKKPGKSKRARLHEVWDRRKKKSNG